MLFTIPLAAGIGKWLVWSAAKYTPSSVCPLFYYFDRSSGPSPPLCNCILLLLAIRAQPTLPICFTFPLIGPSITISRTASRETSTVSTPSLLLWCHQWFYRCPLPFNRACVERKRKHDRFFDPCWLVIRLRYHVTHSLTKYFCLRPTFDYFASCCSLPLFPSLSLPFDFIALMSVSPTLTALNLLPIDRLCGIRYEYVCPCGWLFLSPKRCSFAPCGRLQRSFWCFCSSLSVYRSSSTKTCFFLLCQSHMLLLLLLLFALDAFGPTIHGHRITLVVWVVLLNVNDADRRIFPLFLIYQRWLYSTCRVRAPCYFFFLWAGTSPYLYVRC